MSRAINDCFRICGYIVGKSILLGIPIALLWPLAAILCGGRMVHFIALER